MIVNKVNNHLCTLHTVLREINVYTFENSMHIYFKDVFDPFDVLSQAKYLDTKHMNGSMEEMVISILRK